MRKLSIRAYTNTEFVDIMVKKPLYEKLKKSQKARDNTGQAHIQCNIADIKNLSLIINNTLLLAFKRLKAKGTRDEAAHPAREARKLATKPNVYVRSD